MIWVPTFLMRQCSGLWCRCYLSFHLDDPLASGLCSSKQQRAYGPSQSYPHPNGRRRILDFCLHWGHVWDTRNKVPDSWDSVSSMSVVICGYSYDFINFRAPAAAGFDGIIDPTTTVRILLEIVPDSPSKRSNQHCLGVSTRASGSTITGASNFDWYIPCSIHSRIERDWRLLDWSWVRGQLAHLGKGSLTIWRQYGRVCYTCQSY